MTRAELAHVLRAAAKIANDPSILVVVSHAILGSFSEDELPEAACRSIKADLAFFDERDGQRKADIARVAILSCVTAPIRHRILEWLESAQRRLQEADMHRPS